MRRLVAPASPSLSPSGWWAPRRRHLAAVAACAALVSGLPLGPAARLHAQRGLTRAVDARLDSPPFRRQLWGIAVMDDGGRLLYARNADRLFIPASTAKLAVTAVAAARLPPTWVVRTSLYGTEAVRDGVLQGDLVLYGRGDPTWSRRCYGTDSLRPGVCESEPMWAVRRLADSLRARGVRSIAGNVVGDGSWLEPTLVHPAWENYDLNWWYAAPVSGLGFNDNSVDLTWGAGPAVGAPPLISFAPSWTPIVLDNRAVTTPGDTGTNIDFFREPATLRIRAEGRVAQTGRGRTEYFALPDPNYFAALALWTALREAGITVSGSVKSTTDSTAFRSVRAGPPLAEVTSRPLSDWIFPVLNTSQNWFAEILLKQLGRQFGRAGSWREGIAVERRFLIDSLGVDSTQLALVDGSGLANSNLITPLALVRILQAMRRHPRAEPFLAALPRAGQRGSLARRFGGTPADGRVAAKPGTIARVNALAGYLELEGGRTVTFAVLANHHALTAPAATAQIDSVIVDLARAFARR
ncbi:MAG TPA: D-alanyl-D-alanine carboxypeptidase/D-alanyl-D-alanine-endopeptidase [Gemmatimonadales bacterium]|nr:D-alanyl-D-alanine carboxypeptidase/D-alanyl-D-alanine-endopeptidase [Gemmatimonadales bacterium]